MLTFHNLLTLMACFITEEFVSMNLRVRSVLYRLSGYDIKLINL
jgi:hypothetical protein